MNYEANIQQERQSVSNRNGRKCGPNWGPNGVKMGSEGVQMAAWSQRSEKEVPGSPLQGSNRSHLVAQGHSLMPCWYHVGSLLQHLLHGRSRPNGTMRLCDNIVAGEDYRAEAQKMQYVLSRNYPEENVRSKLVRIHGPQHRKYIKFRDGPGVRDPRDRSQPPPRGSRPRVGAIPPPRRSACVSGRTASPAP